uniref:Ankyrin repeat domain-containing protein n=1 Tax=Caenorhabditis japonica TaxID=281687 RepID=A0A8R1IJX5_CAEJA
DQIVPIVELMAVNSSHFARLHKFIRLQLPAGFPIKIEIPLFHIVSARVAFQNVNVAGKYVAPLEGNNVFIEEAAFQVPAGYSDDRGDGRYGITWADDEERRGRGVVAVAAQGNSEELSLQLAIEQSLREASGVNSVSAPTTSSVPSEDQQLAELLHFAEAAPPSDTELFRAIRDSQVEADRHLREQEQFELELKKVLELSKTEQ